MSDAPIPTPRATLKDRIERDRLSDAVERGPGTGTKRLASLVAAAKAKTKR